MKIRITNVKDEVIGEMGTNRDDLGSFLMLANSMARTLYPEAISINHHISPIDIKLLEKFMEFLKNEESRTTGQG